MVSITSHKDTLIRQVNHWHQAATRLSNLDNQASENAWKGIDFQLGKLIRESLENSISKVLVKAEILKSEIEAVSESKNITRYFAKLQDLRVAYLRSEETIHFYTIAVNSRTTPGIASLLRACDILCVKSMQEIFNRLNRKTPKVLTYVSKGRGASILKSGLRLWDGSLSSIAAIKVTQHNLYRPTAIIHETGHQMAHVLDWNTELSFKLRKELDQHPEIVGKTYALWSSEMAADAFAFVHTGYAAVAALHDVVSDLPHSIFAFRGRDPHPVSYLRLLLNTEMCRQFYGSGPWDDLEYSFKNIYNIDNHDYKSIPLIKECVRAVPEVVELILKTPYQAFDNHSLSELIPPERVSPNALRELEIEAGPSIYTSHAWISNDCLRLLALGGYKIGVGQGDLPLYYRQQEEWMTKLGFETILN